MRKCEITWVVLVLLMGGYSVAGTASFQGLGHLDGLPIESYANAVSDDGSTVVGHSGNGIGGGTSTNGEAFRWTSSEGMVGLGDLPNGLPLSGAFCVSAEGSVIGGGSNSTDGSNGNAKEAFRWTESTGMVGLGYLTDGSHESTILGMSGDGSILAGWGSGQPFYWTESTGMVHIGNLGGDAHAKDISSNGNVIVGNSQSPSGSQVFHWTQTNGMVGIGDLSGGIFESIANGTNSDGSVIVGMGNSSLGLEAFRWTEAEGMIGLGDLSGGAFCSNAWDVSADGSIIVGEGTTSTTALGNEAFIWDASNGMQNLRDVLINDCGLDLTGWTLATATGISADGLTIVGFGSNPDGYTEAWIAEIPEPATISLMAVGALTMLRRRKP